MPNNNQVKEPKESLDNAQVGSDLKARNKKTRTNQYSAPRSFYSLSTPLPQDLGQELLKAKRDVPVPVIVEAFENVRHAFELYAALHEEVEAHFVLAALVVRAE